ncbi:MAG: acyl-CoA dehydratase activase [Desulfobacterota bacterium]|nr:acyl-CoA dehydratase activase [Thermodesulfobacteriota bacterium]
MRCLLGIDIGSVSVKAALVSPDGNVLCTRYRRSYGRPLAVLRTVLAELIDNSSAPTIIGVAATGTGGKLISEILGCRYINEAVAQSRATAALHPEVRTIIEIGGEDAKLMVLALSPGSSRAQLQDVAMNTICAAGTGSFLDQQAQRLGISIEHEFGIMACRSEHPPRIAGRCSVFAKSDMIHLQQAATPAHDIVMGLCLALARTFKSTVIKNRPLNRPIAFQGGVAANAGMVRAFEQVLEIPAGELIIPKHFACMGAIGAVLCMLDTGSLSPFIGLEPLDRLLRAAAPQVTRHDPLPMQPHQLQTAAEPIIGETLCDAYLGVDVGSISTNIVVLDASGRVIARRYLMTAGRPIEAVRQGLAEIGAEIGDRVIVRAAATTGSGRYLIGDFVGADIVINEITAHARGAISVDPRVDTIFEIGGQDSKYIRIENGAVVDFTMNKVCAAGTGSFLEEQAEKLGISIKGEFSRMAFSSRAPAALGERCTVFMESSLNRLQQQGVATEDLVAGLCYSIVLNYLGKVVEDRPVGDVVFFQGGTAYNAGVTAAFEKVCGKKIIVPPHHDVLGAIGCALIARDRLPHGPSQFKGFQRAYQPYTLESFECHDCPNACVIRRVTVDKQETLHYGSRCGKFDEAGKISRGAELPRLFAEREKLLLEAASTTTQIPDRGPIIGIPRATIFYELFPFWQAFFATLGYRLIPSPPTTRRIIDMGCETALEEPCFPIKAAHGHILELLQQGVDYLFLPCIVNAPPFVPDAAASYICLYIQSLPYTVRAAIDTSAYRTTILSPPLHLGWGKTTFLPQLEALGQELGCAAAQVRKAYETAQRAQEYFSQTLRERGRAAIAAVPENTPVTVMVSRTYNGCDPGLMLNIPDKLRDLGALAVPLDMLDLAPPPDVDLSYMYWRSGQRIIAAAHTIARNPRLQAIYITNFGCGPDSFITKHFKRAMQGKPYLTVELDEHSADAGVLTRLEAFMDSLSQSSGAAAVSRPVCSRPGRPAAARNRTVYIPYMDDHGRPLSAALRFFGIRAEALPMSDEDSIACARPFTTGKECYPFILTTGDIIKQTRAPDFHPSQAAFLMASAAGPCRFGQYSIAHRMVLDELGFSEVPLITLDQTVGFARDLRQLGSRFRRLGWRVILVVDYFKKLLLHIRPYEKTAGDSDSVYEACLERLEQHVERFGEIGDCCEDARRRFASIAVDRSVHRPLIGVVGEIYVRSHAFSNDWIVRRIEALGGEVLMPPLQEWVAYTDWERAKDLRRAGTLQDRIKERVSRWVQHRDAVSIRNCFDGCIGHFLDEAPPEALMRLSAPYLSEHVRGEANLSIGRAVEYISHGCHGIVNLMPFGCMPGTIVNALLCRFSREHPNVPILKMAYDGTRQSGDEVRIETFMHQAYTAWADERRN